MSKPMSKMQPRKRLIVFDIDGTLSDVTHRERFARDKDYETFYSLMSKDSPRREVVDLLLSFHNLKKVCTDNLCIVILTGRPCKYETETVKCIEKHTGLKEHEDYILIMRENGDYRNDGIFKNEIIELLQNGIGDIAFMIDDRESVIKTIERKTTIKVIQA